MEQEVNRKHDLKPAVSLSANWSNIYCPMFNIRENIKGLSLALENPWIAVIKRSSSTSFVYWNECSIFRGEARQTPSFNLVTISIIPGLTSKDNGWKIALTHGHGRSLGNYTGNTMLTKFRIYLLAELGTSDTACVCRRNNCGSKRKRSRKCPALLIRKVWCR